MRKEFVLNFILNDIEHKQLFYDSKTILTGDLYRKKVLQPIEYVLTGEEGPDHDKCFTVEVQVNGQSYGKWHGSHQKGSRTGSCLSGDPGKEILTATN